MTIHEGWQTMRGTFGTLVVDPSGNSDVAYRRGVISYLPASMVGATQNESWSPPKIAMGEDNIQNTESGTDVHNTFIENANQLLQCTQAASCYSGISNQPNYDELCQKICGEGAKAARQSMNHSMITQIQKDTFDLSRLL